MIALRNKHRASARFGVSCAVASLLTACGALPDASGFAAAVLRLYSDELLWSAIRTAALTALEQNFSGRGFGLALGTPLQAVWKRSESGT